MFSNNGYSLADVAAATGNNRNGGMWDDGAWWIVILLLFGWGNGYGFGGMGGANNPGLQGIATRADINEGFALNDIQNGIRGIQQGICDSTYALNNSIQNGFNETNVGMLQGFNSVQQAINADTVAGMQNTNAIQSTLNNMAAQNASCCCETQRQIERGFADTNYNMATQACETRQAIVDGTRSILDFLTQDKIATLTAENQSLKFQASQTAQNAFITANQDAQTAELIRRINPMPVPAYTVPAPYAYSGCGCTAGCGC